MADELTLSGVLSFLKNGVKVSLDLGTLEFDVSGDKYVHAVQTVGTSEEAIGIGDLGTLGFAVFVNRDDTNFCEIRPGTGTADLIKLKPGEFALFRFTMNTPYIIADTDSVLVEYVIIEN
jgi:hypothetical protein